MPGFRKPSKVLETQGDRQMDPVKDARGTARGIALDAMRRGRYKNGVAQPVAKPPLKVGSESQGKRYGKAIIEKGVRP